MNKFKKFAIEMSEQLYQMRGEDLNMSIVFTDDDREIPEDFIKKVLDDKLHIAAIKEKIRMSVLEDVQQNPNEYDMNGDEYVYSGDIYNHAYLVDIYLEDYYEVVNPVMETRLVCDICGSDNVQSRAWVRPNKNNEFVDLMTEDIQDNYCGDCDKNVTTSSVTVVNTVKVIGFQVQSTNGKNEIHPHMDGSFCLYNLTQALSMRDDDNNGDESWELLAIWESDVEDPTIMFEGNPRA